jgi:hypothetical protein
MMLTPCLEVAIGPYTIARVWNSEAWMVTRIDGYPFVSTGNPDDDDAVALAHELGYGGDTWAMSRDHELLHSWLAVRRGLPFSPTLWAVSRGDKRLTADAIREWEEGDILALQKFLNLGVCDPDLDRVAPPEGRDQLLREAADFLEAFRRPSTFTH